MKKGLIFALKLLVLLVLMVWVSMVFIDYFRTRNNKLPKFCLTENTYNYDDGKTYECVGLGYKMYKYDRVSITATEFGPIFIRERTNTEGINN